MKICGIVSEYNPFHNGHLYQLEESRRMGATHIVAVMSGNFVQRGDTAVLDKFVRAKLAVACGVDLVLELPVPYCLAPAEVFARGAVYLLDALGCVAMLSFGSESGDLPALRRASRLSAGLSNSPELRGILEQGSSFPAAMQKLAAREADAEAADIFAHPNNLLGIEYLKALAYFRSGITPLTIRRVAAPHDSEISGGGIASASYIRKMLREKVDFQAFLPKCSAEALANYQERGWLASFERLEPAILYKFRSMTAQEIQRLPDVSHGLENRIVSAAQTASSLEELMFSIKTKRYPMARIRRILLTGLLGIEKQLLLTPPPYGRILAVNRAGCEILKRAKKTSGIPLGTQLLKLAKTSPGAARFVRAETASTDIYALSGEKIRSGGLDYTAKIQQQNEKVMI